MPDLVAQGSLPEHRWRRTIPVGRRVALGRSSGTWSIPWDDRISRRHVVVEWQEDRLNVSRLDGATNPVFFQGQREDQFTLSAGEHFVIGATTFSLTDEHVELSLDSQMPATEQAFSSMYLNRVRFRDADRRVEVLGQLPEIISGATSDNEMFVRVVNLLLSGIPGATAVALVEVETDQTTPSTVNVLHWDSRSVFGQPFSPSVRLIQTATERGESVVHIWCNSGDDGEPAYTQRNNFDWAFCTPISNDAGNDWAVYVAGQFPTEGSSPESSGSPNKLRDDLKFTEIAGTTLGRLRRMRMLERKDASLRQFFSPVVLEALAESDPDEILAPRKVNVSVLFCDLRGFSRKTEESSADLLGLLRRVSDALGVTTNEIHRQGGVVGDFHGDATMGFWGWPLEQEQIEGRACRAALAIRSAFISASSESSLADFTIGIGIATGPAVAGKIGTVDQVKVTVFGPVVNLASRLETMTKHMRASILLDEATANAVRQNISSDIARIRRVARVRPYGMDASLEISELLPPVAEYPDLTDEHIASYEQALDALTTGDWTEAFSLLHNVPAADRVKDFLTVFIAQHNRTPPPNWDGVIPLESK